MNNSSLGERSPLIPSPISYVESTASPISSEKGKVISQGKHTTRLQLGEDSRFHIAAKVIRSGNLADYAKNYLTGKIGKAFGSYVEMKNNNDIVFVNINSVAKRLNIQKEKIKEAAKQGNLPDLLTTKAKETQSTKVVIPEKESKTDKSEVISPTLLNHKEKAESEKTEELIIASYKELIEQFGNETETGLSETFSETLMKVIRTAVTTELPTYTPVEIKDRTYHIGFDKDKKKIELANLGKLIGSGQYGQVREFNVQESSTEIIKIAKSTEKKRGSKEKAEEILKNEFDQLRKMNEDGEVWGIQSAPRQLVLIAKGSIKEKGYIGEKYERNYNTELKNNLPFESRLADFHQILAGVAAMAQKKLVHPDPKPENILVKTDKDGMRLVQIADFGGVSDLDSKIMGSPTPAYTAQEDIELQYQELTEETKKEIKIKQSVFGWGVTLQQAITGQREVFKEYSKGMIEFAIASSRKPLPDNIPPELKQLLDDMLNPDYKQRPTPQEAFARYDNWLKQNHPEVHQQIQAKMQEYPGSKALLSK